MKTAKPKFDKKAIGTSILKIVGFCIIAFFAGYIVYTFIHA